MVPQGVHTRAHYNALLQELRGSSSHGWMVLMGVYTRNTHAYYNALLQELRGNSSQSWMVPAGVPVLGVGHSNGALLHLLNRCVRVWAAGAAPNLWLGRELVGPGSGFLLHVLNRRMCVLGKQEQLHRSYADREC
eukprot:1160067-Pelagomonas_calceolata.AAC.1